MPIVSWFSGKFFCHAEGHRLMEMQIKQHDFEGFHCYEGGVRRKKNCRSCGS
jgi:hypothetical protein